jgi:hypothetical protein
MIEAMHLLVKIGVVLVCTYFAAAFIIAFAILIMERRTRRRIQRAIGRVSPLAK